MKIINKICRYAQKVFLCLGLVFCLSKQGYASPEFADYSEAIAAATDDIAAANYSDARVSASEALALAKSEAEKGSVYLILGLINTGEGKYRQAQEVFESALKLKGLESFTHFSLYQALGQSYFATGKYDEAAKAYSKALKTPNQQPMAYYSMQTLIGLSWLQRKAYKQARKEFGELAKYKTSVSVATVARDLYIGLTYLKEGNTIASKREFSQVIANQDIIHKDTKVIRKDPFAYLRLLYGQQAQLGLADSYFSEKNYAQAKIEYSKTLAMEKLNPSLKAQAQKQLKAIADLEAPSKKEDTTK